MGQLPMAPLFVTPLSAVGGTTAVAAGHPACVLMTLAV